METLIHNSIKLGFGLMRLPTICKSGIERINLELTANMVDAFIKSGGKYFDTAFVYEGSEEAIREALVNRYPRNSYYLANKVNASKFAAENKEKAREEILISLERTNAKYFDFYLLHALGKANRNSYDEYGLWDYVKGLKKEGKIRHWGFSFHDSPDFLDELLTEHPDTEFVQLQINYADWDDPVIQSRRCYDIALKHNIPIIVMEPVKGGMLSNPPQIVKNALHITGKEGEPSPSSWAIRFAASLPNVMIVLSGMSNQAQMEDNLSFMNAESFQPLNIQEQRSIMNAQKALGSINTIACTACRYCISGCPKQINIPSIFKCMNIYKAYSDLSRAKNRYMKHHNRAKASECVQCGQCENVCPQQLQIIQYLKECATTLE